MLAKKFASPKDAITSMTDMQSPYSPVQVEHVRVGGCDTPASSSSSIPIFKEESSFLLLSSDEQLVLVSDMFKHIASNKYSLDAPDDFVELALKGMQKLISDGKSNVIYGLCKGFGCSRPEKENESYFPTSRMPMGLLEYMVNFFITKHGNKVCYYVNTFVSVSTAIMKINHNFRSIAPPIIQSGYRVCTLCLELNGVSCIVVLLGRMKLLNREQGNHIWV